MESNIPVALIKMPGRVCRPNYTITGTGSQHRDASSGVDQHP